MTAREVRTLSLALILPLIPVAPVWIWPLVTIQIVLSVAIYAASVLGVLALTQGAAQAVRDGQQAKER